MRKHIYEKWIDRTAEAEALGLIRQSSIVHSGWQIGPGGYAANGVTTQEAAAMPANLRHLFSTSVGVWALCSNGSTMKLHLSADGIAAYAEKFSTSAGWMHDNLSGQLVDCGSNRLFLFEYDNRAETHTVRIWNSTDGGENWAVLLTTATDSITHFHGGLWDATNSRLYVFTGDGGIKNSILHCNDVADLIANPLTWRTRWGLDDATRSTINASYYVGYNSDVYRVVGAVLKNNYVITGTDLYSNPGGSQLSRIHRTTLAFSQIPIEAFSSLATNGNGIGELWHYGVSDNGIVLVSSPAQPPANEGDQAWHLYALNPDERTARQILRVPASTYVQPYDIQVVGGFTVLPMYGVDSPQGYAGNVRMRGAMSMSPVTLTARRYDRPGVKSFDNMLLESGDALLLESDDHILGD